MSERQTLEALERAYQGMEDESSFADEATLTAYREGLLERNAAQAEFIAALVAQPGSIFEVGCGNGRLLIDLSRRGKVASGVGVDLAQSRVDFAARWARDAGLTQLEFVRADALEHELAPESLDAALCVTSALAYFDPIAPGAAERLLARLGRALRPHGTIVLEVYPHPEWRALLAHSGGRLRLWHELPEDDPWRFYLSDLAWNPEGEILTHAKTFVHRTETIVDSGRVEQIVLYTSTTLRALLERTGYVEIELYEGWTERPYEGGELLVATGRRSG
jgi:SAM-dependent methyltransferase